MKSADAESGETVTDSGPPLVASLDLRTISAARDRLRGSIVESPIKRAGVASRQSGADVVLKHDHVQATGSFKERGAGNALALLHGPARARGVVAASAGNHALGLARHGARLGVPVTLVMPRSAATVKVERCRSLGATVLLHGGTFDEADHFARELSLESSRRYVHPFDDVAVMAGQGTLGLELIEQVPDVDAVVLPVGGGGLLAGVSVAMKSLRPHVRIIAVEPEAAASYAVSWRSGEVRSAPVGSTLADGLAVARVGPAAFAVSHGLVDDVITVSEDEIAAAMLHLFEYERTAAEGAGAVALAAVLSGKIERLAGKRVVVPICGANVDPAIFARALQRGLSLQGLRAERSEPGPAEG